MSFWERIKQWFRNLMNGRHGSDQLCMALLWTGLACYLLGSILGSIANTPVLSVIGMILNVAGFAAYAFTIFRMFSRDTEKRDSENRRYLAWRERGRTKRRQAKTRFQNRNKYKYFKCPGCKAWLRLPRGSGVVTVTCSRCHNSFTQKS